MRVNDVPGSSGRTVVAIAAVVDLLLWEKKSTATAMEAEVIDRPTLTQ